MKTSRLTVLVSALAFAGLAHAQSPTSEIRESTDPARVAEVEQRAADLQARQQAARQDMTSGDGSSSNATGERRMRAKSHSPRHSGRAGGHGAGHSASDGAGSGSSNK